MKFKKIIRRLIYMSSTVVLVCSLGFAGFQVYQLYNQKQTTDSIKKAAGEPTSKEEVFVPDFLELQKINKEVNAYIYWPKLDISLPIVQGRDNSYYLHKDLYGNNSEFGSVFLDAKNRSNYSDLNNIVYGHSVFGWTGVFTRIKELMNINVFDNNKEFILFTPNQNYRCEVFAFFTGTPDDELYQINFMDRLDFEDWVEMIKEKSLYKNETTHFSIKDKVITLSTCMNEHGKERYIVYAKMTPDNTIKSTHVQ